MNNVPFDEFLSNELIAKHTGSTFLCVYYRSPNTNIVCISRIDISDGKLNTWQFLQWISHTVGNMKATPSSSESEFSEDEGDQNTNTEPVCVVCLTKRNNTGVFLPCKHASFCGDCSGRIMTLGQNCPVCRSNIEARLEIFTN